MALYSALGYSSIVKHPTTINMWLQQNVLTVVIRKFRVSGAYTYGTNREGCGTRLSREDGI